MLHRMAHSCVCPLADPLRDLYTDSERTLPLVEQPPGEGQWVQSAVGEDFTPWQTGHLAGSMAFCLSGPPHCFPRAAGSSGAGPMPLRTEVPGGLIPLEGRG